MAMSGYDVAMVLLLESEVGYYRNMVSKFLSEEAVIVTDEDELTPNTTYRAYANPGVFKPVVWASALFQFSKL